MNFIEFIIIQYNIQYNSEFNKVHEKNPLEGKSLTFVKDFQSLQSNMRVFMMVLVLR